MATSPHPIGAPLSLRTLGTVGVYGPDDDSALLGPGKPLALLVFLALAPGRRASRETLMDLLWSDVARDRARPSVRQAVFQLRRILGDEAIVGTDELVLTDQVVADRDLFLSALEVGRLEDAIALYQGPFLPAFGVPGGAAFEHWADLERDRLEAGFVRCAELLVRRLLNQSQAKEARQLARRVRDLVPASEATGRLILETSIAGRDFVTAVMEAESLERWAASEGLTLEPATVAAISRARRVVTSPDNDRGQRNVVAELIGREREFSMIIAAWDAVRKGPARHVHLAAPAGLGKTRLLSDAVARLAATGAAVVSIRGMPGDRDVPYAFASDLAAALAAQPGAAGLSPASASVLLTLNPALSAQYSGVPDSASGEDALLRRIQALAELLHAVADEQRVVLAIDDVHWIDHASFRVLEGVWGRLTKSRVLCLTASRPERVPTSECAVLPLAPLDVSNVGALVGALGALPAPSRWAGDFIARLFEATRGSPLLVLETLQLLLDKGILSLDDSGWQCHDERALADALHAGEALRERVRSLPQRQRAALGLLATVGSPLGASALASIADQSEAEVLEQLPPLERLGLIARSGDGWIPAHDELAAAARERLSVDEQQDAERRIGEYFVRTSGDEQNGLLRAARHLAAARDLPALERLYRRYARVLRANGDRRPYVDMAKELLAADSASNDAHRLVASLPRAWRMGFWSRARQTAALATVLVLSVVSLFGMRRRAIDDRLSQRLFFADSLQRISSLTVARGDFDGESAPLAREASRSALAEAAMGYPEQPPFTSPDGRATAWIQDSGDSTILDIWLRTPEGTRRLTFEPRDDIVTGWLPDGSAIVGATNRWTPKADGGYDIAVFDTATGQARQVTRGRAHDTNASVSPDGTRVAFTRNSDESPLQLCVTTIDGAAEPECRLIDGQPMGELLGWSGVEELALTNTSSSEPLLVYDWSRRTVRHVLGPHVRYPRLSPDRRWVVAAIRANGIRGYRDWIAPLDNPSQARPLAAAEGGVPIVRWWEGRPDQSLLIDHIEFTDTASLVTLGVGTRLRVRSLTVDNREVRLLAPIRWQSSDTLIATVDSLGEVRPRRNGSVTITASLVNWRFAQKRLRVTGSPAVSLADEQWDASWRDRWIVWGYPQPLVATGPEGVRGFFNNGEGSYRSVGVFRRTLPAEQGLGVEVRISSPLNSGKWQRVGVSLTAGIDTGALLATDQQKAPPTLDNLESQCGFFFPLDGTWGETWIAANGSVTENIDLGEFARPLRTGDWWTVRLQILPDGRCGIAINQRVIWISPEAIALGGAFRLRLGDNSNGTTLLHGPLQIWSGVKSDIRWVRDP